MNEPNDDSPSPEPGTWRDPHDFKEGTPPTASAHPVSPLNIVDWVAVPILLGSGLAAQIIMTGAQVSLRAPFWMDEIASELLGTDPSFRHMVRALTAGVDANPPAFVLLLRVVTAAAV